MERGHVFYFKFHNIWSFLFNCRKKGFQYSADVSQANKAMRWGVGLLGLELLGFIEAVFDTPLEAVISLAIGCIPAIMYIIGARRNRPHTEEAI